MTRKLLPLLAAALLLLAFSAGVAAEKGKDLYVCPVCGFVIEDTAKATAAVHEGETYYFCDPGCKAYFQQNTELMTSGKTMDYVCGMVIDRDKAHTMIEEGWQLSFCSETCMEKYKASPADYAMNYDVVSHEVKLQKEMTYTTEYAGRTFFFASEENKDKFKKHPENYIFVESIVCGDVFLMKDAAANREYEGTTYYFGCNSCVEKFDKDPAKFIAMDPSERKGCASGAGGCKHAAGAKGCPHSKSESGCPHAKKAASDKEI